jgi:hypothetical protein
MGRMLPLCIGSFDAYRVLRTAYLLTGRRPKGRVSAAVREKQKGAGNFSPPWFLLSTVNG